MFVNTCMCPVNSFLSSIIASLRARTFTNTHACTHQRTYTRIHFTHLLSKPLVCFTSCSCVLLCVFSFLFFAVLHSYMINMYLCFFEWYVTLGSFRVHENARVRSVMLVFAIFNVFHNRQ